MTHPTSFAEFNAIPATGPTYTELAREVEALKEDNAALLDFARCWEGGLEDVVENGGGADLGWMDRAKAAEMLAVIRADHPGTALAAEVERLREDNSRLTGLLDVERQKESTETARAECQRLLAALDTVNEREAHFRRLYHEEKQETARLRVDMANVVKWGRLGEVRQQAVLDLAHELAELEPSARDAAIRRIIDNHEDKP